MSFFNNLRLGFTDNELSDIISTVGAGIGKTGSIPNNPDYNYVAINYVTKDAALSALGMTDAEYKEFKEYKAMSPLQRVLSDLDYSEEFLTILFATNTYRKENMKLDLMEFKTKEEHIVQANKYVKKIEFMNSKQLLIKAIYNLYYAYYIGVNGTKVDQMVEASKHTYIEKEKPINIEICPVKGKNWKKNQKRRLKGKVK